MADKEIQKFLDLEGLKILWNQLSLKDYPNNETLVAVINAIDETKQDKNLVVTKGSDGLVSHTPAEILEHIQNGGKAIYYDGGTEHEFLEGNNKTSVFYSNFIDANKIQFSIYQIKTDRTVESTRSEYKPSADSSVATKEYVTTSIENKKEKDLIVTRNQTGSRVTHSVAEMMEAFNEGTTIKFQEKGKLLNLLEITSDFATFYIIYMNINGKLQQKVIAISGQDIILEQDDIYDYATLEELTNSLKNYYTKTETEQQIEANFNESIIALSIDGRVITYIKGDGTTHSFETQDTNTEYFLATDEVTGLTKLYSSIGNAEDGTMTQKAIKTELDKKVGVTINNNMLVFTV